MVEEEDLEEAEEEDLVEGMVHGQGRGVLGTIGMWVIMDIRITCLGEDGGTEIGKQIK